MEPIAASSRLIRNSIRFVTQIADCFSCEAHEPPRSPREGGKNGTLIDALLSYLRISLLGKRKGEMEPIAASSRLIRNSIRFVTQIADCFYCEAHEPPRSREKKKESGFLGGQKMEKKKKSYG
ncbi:hypothetical protein CEXT_734301 [Caerostris extrusa]|uniref:Uncharacterized protein n=1 Tax=Caerostris extrusa TaxID=172846 RepID=A0AAV4UXR8_CAEEX|nr:hypothetical protein CEXT_734301 [Caerostris extrusa]